MPLPILHALGVIVPDSEEWRRDFISCESKFNEKTASPVRFSFRIDKSIELTFPPTSFFCRQSTRPIKRSYPLFTEGEREIPTVSEWSQERKGEERRGRA